MSLASLFVYGVAITVIAVTGSVKYAAAVRKEQTEDIASSYGNWGN